MEYIKATEKDSEQIFKLVQDTIKTIYPKYYPKEVVDFFCELHCQSSIEKDIKSGSTGILVNDGIVVGTGCYRDNHITRVYVAPAYQRQGYGSYIMQCLEDEICIKYDTACLDASLPAGRFYKSLGYKTIKNEKYIVKNNVILEYEIMEKMMKISNYEKMKNNMAEVFLQYDQETMIGKFGLEQDENYLYICCLNRKYRINRLNGQITWSKDAFRTEEKADYNEAMTIYDVLCCSKEDCHLANEWVNVGSLSAVQGGTLAKGGDFFQDAGKSFDGKTEALIRACELLQGKRLEKGDVAYELDLFPFLPVIVRFWESDDGFPASLQILVDRNILDFMHYETAMFAITHLLQRLKDPEN